MAEVAPKKKTNFVKERLPFIVATGGEFIGLYFWLYYWDLGYWALATILLWGGFLTERLAVIGWVKYFQDQMRAQFPYAAQKEKADKEKAKADGTYKPDLSDRSPAQALFHLGLICLSEITIWVIFVIVYEYYGWVASFAVLLIGEQLEHSMELGLMAKRPITDYLPSMNALSITLLEAVGGILWLYLVRNGQPQLGGFFLLLGLTIEHTVQGQAIKTDLKKPFAEVNAEEKKRVEGEESDDANPAALDLDPAPQSA